MRLTLILLLLAYRLPFFVSHNPANKSAGDSKTDRQCGLANRGVERADFLNLKHSQFVTRMSGSMNIPGLLEHIPIVVLASSKEKMIEPYASSNVALMTHAKPVWNEPVFSNHPSSDMGVYIFGNPLSSVYVPITLRRCSTSPDVAVIGSGVVHSNLSPKSGEEGFRKSLRQEEVGYHFVLHSWTGPNHSDSQRIHQA